MTIKFKNLTRTNIRSLKANDKIREHGIEFERLPNGDGRYAINVMVDGMRIHRCIGRESEGVTRLQVEDAISKLRSDARQGRLSLPKGRKLSLNFVVASEKYLEKLKEENGKDINKKQQRFVKHLNPFFGKIPLCKLTTSDIEQYQASRKNNGAKNSTINRELSAASHLLNKAVDWKWIDYMPCKIKRLKEENTRITYLTKEQIHLLFEEAKKDQNIYIYPFVVIGLYTSMRKTEILSMRIKDIDLEKAVIYIPKAKAGARTQPITKALVGFLKNYLEKLPPAQEFLFESKSAANGFFIAIEKPFRRVVENAGMDPKQVVRHTLRHTAITHLVQAGIDLPTVQRISGHKTLQMVVRYSHQNGEHIQQAMDKLEQRYHNMLPESI